MLTWRLCIQFNGIRSTKVQQIFLLMDYYQLPDILERSGYGFNLSINNECNFSGLIVVEISLLLFLKAINDISDEVKQ
jgi:hypothetical protein